jgi:hypothetical protein
MAPRKSDAPRIAVDPALRPPERELFALIAAKFGELAQLFAEVATLEGHPDRWTSVRLPPGRSRRWFAEFCLAQYRQDEPRVRKLGRVWECERSLLEEALPPRRRGPAVANNDDEAANDDEPWSPERALEEAGLLPRKRAV